MIEVVITLAIVIMVMVIVLQGVTAVEQSWKSTATSSFTEAESGFESMARNLASATLEPYWDYADSSGAFRTNSTSTFTPDHLARRSDLDFVCGPGNGTNGLLAGSGRITSGSAVFFMQPAGYSQTLANTGMERLLNARGYFVEFGDDSDVPSFFPATSHRWRWRLKEVRQEAEALQVFTVSKSSDWMGKLVAPGAITSVVADNVILLIVLPERSASDSGTPLAQDFRYDSRDDGNPLTRHQLPPRLRLVLMAMDEASAQILAQQNGSNPPGLVAANLFQQASSLDTDLVTLDATLTAQKIRHRLFQREILLNGAAWSNTTSQ